MTDHEERRLTPKPRLNKRLLLLHQHVFGEKPVCVSVAPGRLILLGAGQYSEDGLSIASCIGRHIWAAASPREDRRLVVHSEWARQTLRFSPRPPTPTGHGFWGDYALGIWSGLAAGRVERRGVSLTLAGDLPPGIGLGSSSALQIAIAFVLRQLWELSLDDRDLALVAHRAENLFVGIRSGIVDPMVTAYARKGKALLLDSNTLETEQIDFPSGLVFVVCDSGVHRTLAYAPFNKRMSELEEALHYFRNRYPGLSGFRQVSAEMLVQAAHELPQDVLRRARHVITENDRARRAAIALRWADIDKVGGLLTASYRSLRDGFESSSPELDEIIQLSRGIGGVFGSHVTGPGFGGCTAHLVEKSHAPEVVRGLRRGYRTPAGRIPRVLTFAPVHGASSSCGER